MSQRILIAVFEREHDLLEAVRDVREAGGRIRDAYTPYAVHGLDEALGWQPSRLSWVCAVCGFAGAALLYGFQHWTGAVSWPVNVGGKPYQSLPAYVPVIFEAMVLCGAVGTVLAYFATSRLWPGRRPRQIAPAVTDDRFALVVEEADARCDAARISHILARNSPTLIEQRAEETVEAPAARPWDEEAPAYLRWLNPLLAGLLVAVVLAVLLLPRQTTRLNLEFMPTMRHSSAAESQSPFPGLPAGRLDPAPGTVARDEHPLHFAATEADARRAAEELHSPLTADDPSALERGRFVYFNFCASCHGSGGLGDGPTALRGYPPPPQLPAGKSREMKDGELFHVISYGRLNMPPHRKQLSQRDRWCVIQYIRGLQQSAAQAEQTGAAATATVTNEAATSPAAPASKQADVASPTSPAVESDRAKPAGQGSP